MKLVALSFCLPEVWQVDLLYFRVLLAHNECCILTWASLNVNHRLRTKFSLIAICVRTSKLLTECLTRVPDGMRSSKKIVASTSVLWALEYFSSSPIFLLHICEHWLEQARHQVMSTSMRCIIICAEKHNITSLVAILEWWISIICMSTWVLCIISRFYQSDVLCDG